MRSPRLGRKRTPPDQAKDQLESARTKATRPSCGDRPISMKYACGREEMAGKDGKAGKRWHMLKGWQEMAREKSARAVGSVTGRQVRVVHGLFIWAGYYLGNLLSWQRMLDVLKEMLALCLAS